MYCQCGVLSRFITEYIVVLKGAYGEKYEMDCDYGSQPCHWQDSEHAKVAVYHPSSKLLVPSPKNVMKQMQFLLPELSLAHVGRC
jgi:hypothetical protein